ncbi:MAG: hypothetical protein Q8L64_01390 [bacterium]|nr:hypothetical protein [bacterium]
MATIETPVWWIIAVHSLKFLVKSRISKPPDMVVLSVNDLYLADLFPDCLGVTWISMRFPVIHIHKPIPAYFPSIWAGFQADYNVM